jgi:hypothetical protein
MTQEQFMAAQSIIKVNQGGKIQLDSMSAKVFKNFHGLVRTN